jgi:hypothetical protein
LTILLAAEDRAQVRMRERWQQLQRLADALARCPAGMMSLEEVLATIEGSD